MSAWLKFSFAIQMQLCTRPFILLLLHLHILSGAVSLALLFVHLWI